MEIYLFYTDTDKF